MDVLIRPSRIFSGQLRVPPSKSYTQRALVSSFLVPKLEISNIGRSSDELAVLNITQELGARIEWLEKDRLIISNTFDFNKDVIIGCGESGLCARLFAGLMLLNKGTTTLIGEGSLVNRPMDSFFPVYAQLGVDYTAEGNNLPICFKGKRQPFNIEIDGSVSSQFVSGILYYMVGLRDDSFLELSIRDLKSRPYLEMTIELLNSLGAQIEWHGEKLVISPAKLNHQGVIVVEGDWSSAAYWIVAAAIGGDIKLEGLNPNSLQADRKILDIVDQYGAKFHWEKGALRVCTHNQQPFCIDLTDSPDLAPIIAVLAMFAEGESTIRGVNRLIFKESNRLEGIVNWLRMLEIPYTLELDVLRILGKSKLNWKDETYNRRVFETYNDHRMVMSSSILASFLMGGTVKGFEAVHKSYPSFKEDMEEVGIPFILI